MVKHGEKQTSVNILACQVNTFDLELLNIHYSINHQSINIAASLSADTEQLSCGSIATNYIEVR